MIIIDLLGSLESVRKKEVFKLILLSLGSQAIPVTF
jgi:hypothetical protein